LGQQAGAVQGEIDVLCKSGRNTCFKGLSRKRGAEAVGKLFNRCQRRLLAPSRARQQVGGELLLQIGGDGRGAGDGREIRF